MALSAKTGIESQITMMLGLPGETEKDVNDTIRFAVELAPDLILFNIFKPIPGSVLYNKLKKENQLLAGSKWEDYLVKSPNPVMRDTLSAGQLEALMKKAYFSFYFRPKYMLRRLKWLAKSPLRELRGYLTAARIFSKMLGKGKANTDTIQ
jgi:anaerobic magnesium-protoporphyrin IX monomethyl ester cyclase